MSETEHPKGELEHPILRTSPQRAAKMMAIMLGIVIVGGIIFFSMWDYWISSPPASVAIAGAADRPSTLVEVTGKEIPVTLSFIESADFRTLAFNALPGEPNNNPDIRAEVGDLLIFDVVNDGKSFHAFGVTSDEEGFAGTFPRSEIGSGSNPLKPGEGGESRFIPPEEGVYYYICTVPGHREQGMVGKIIVGDVSDMPAQTEKMMEPTTSSPVPAPGFEDVPEMIVIEEQDVESPPATMEPFTGTISAPAGSSVWGICWVASQAPPLGWIKQKARHLSVPRLVISRQRRTVNSERLNYPEGFVKRIWPGGTNPAVSWSWWC